LVEEKIIEIIYFVANISKTMAAVDVFWRLNKMFYSNINLLENQQIWILDFEISQSFFFVFDG
jgi:hypothetical protein